jgi:nicotinamide riboside transporter PnuC
MTMTFDAVEVVGFAAFLTNVVGNLLLTRKHIAGWAVRLVSITLWGIYAWDTASPSLLANACTFFLINCYGWHHWRHSLQPEES